jgi:hypothetical protein
LRGGGALARLRAGLPLAAFQIGAGLFSGLRLARRAIMAAVTHRWSARVTRESDALSLEKGVFTLRSARRIAQSLKQSAEHSRRRKSTPFRSAMSMLNFFINRMGTQLSPGRRRILEQAKDELRALYGRKPAAANGKHKR